MNLFLCAWSLPAGGSEFSNTHPLHRAVDGTVCVYCMDLLRGRVVPVLIKWPISNWIQGLLSVFCRLSLYTWTDLDETMVGRGRGGKCTKPSLSLTIPSETPPPPLTNCCTLLIVVLNYCIAWWCRSLHPGRPTRLAKCLKLEKHSNLF